MGKISTYGNDTTPVTTDYVLGNKASGPTTSTFKLSDLITLFFNNITAASVTAAKMAFGVIYRRQGGTTGDNTWQTAGTSNTDTSAKAVFIQAGVGVISAAETTVTFPVAFTQAPIVIGAPQTATSQNTSFRARSVTTTGFIASLVIDGSANTQATSENFGWVAFGQ